MGHLELMKNPEFKASRNIVKGLMKRPAMMPLVTEWQNAWRSERHGRRYMRLSAELFLAFRTELQEIPRQTAAKTLGTLIIQAQGDLEKDEDWITGNSDGSRPGLEFNTRDEVESYFGPEASGYSLLLSLAASAAYGLAHYIYNVEPGLKSFAGVDFDGRGFTSLQCQWTDDLNDNAERFARLREALPGVDEKKLRQAAKADFGQLPLHFNSAELQKIVNNLEEFF